MNSLNPTATSIANKLFETMIASAEGDSIKIDNTKMIFMPVHLALTNEITGHGQGFSIAHYYEQNGDLMSDPYMEFIRTPDNEIIPTLFEHHGGAKHTYQEALLYDKNGSVKGFLATLQNELVSFANTWLLNIKRQQNITIEKPTPLVVLLNINERDCKALIKVKGKLSYVEILQDQEGDNYLLIDETSIYIKDIKA